MVRVMRHWVSSVTSWLDSNEEATMLVEVVAVLSKFVSERGAPCRRVLLVVLPLVPHAIGEVSMWCADFVDEEFGLWVGGDITKRGG